MYLTPKNNVPYVYFAYLTRTADRSTRCSTQRVHTEDRRARCSTQRALRYDRRASSALTHDGLHPVPYCASSCSRSVMGGAEGLACDHSVCWQYLQKPYSRGALQLGQRGSGIGVLSVADGGYLILDAGSG